MATDPSTRSKGCLTMRRLSRFSYAIQLHGKWRIVFKSKLQPGEYPSIDAAEAAFADIERRAA